MLTHRVANRARTALLLALALLAPAAAGDWTHWRGPLQTGVVPDAGPLIESWSKDGENLIWRADFTGRSTPVVFRGRVCATGRVGEGIDRQETAACWDAETGDKLWQRKWNVYLTAVPWTRVSWAAPAADAETGYLYVQGVNGRFVAFDLEGNTVWEWMLGEDLGRFSGYGGRTNTPIVDEDRVIVHSISSAWGPHRPGGDRWIAFDKRTGEILWMTNRNGPPAADLNTYATPVVAMIGGQRLLITGGADGWMRALNARTGEDVWKFRLSQRGLNASPVVDGSTVYVAHSEENLDNGVMGRAVAIDATGKGDVTSTHERWRVDGLQAGYASPVVHDGVLYVPDNSANVVALDTETGKELWIYNYGTVGKGSPVLADGKLYLTEVNGNVVIAKPGKEGAKDLDREHLEMPDGRYAEIYGSPAVAYGRIYFTTEEGIYCLGSKDRRFDADPAPARVLDEPPPAKDAKPALLRVVPGVVVQPADESIRFRAHAFDERGRALGEAAGVSWALAGLPGKISNDGVLALDADKVSGTQVGTVTAKAGDLEATAHLRVAGALPWQEDFESYEAGSAPPAWLGLGKGAEVRATDEGKVLIQPLADRGAPRATVLIGPSYLSDYTIQADVKGQQIRRRKTDVGVVNSGYTAELQGNHQRLHVSSWTSERRMAKEIPFEWEMDVWYTMKSRVDYEDDKAIVRVKVWRRDQPEPADWTFSVEDPHPIRHGAPGLYAYAPTDAAFDNIHVTASR